ncbi:MAG: RNA methyltransferase [Clostridia bacterium]|nr:RNA methyltransferase [Clostridia bacterium]
MERITSRTNSLMTHLRKLNTSRAYRRESGEFPCEGPKLLAEALKWGAEPRTVVFAEGTSLPELPESVRAVEVPAGLLKSVSDTESPQGVLFTCALPELNLPDTLPQGGYLVLDGVQDPGNVGTIWRTADAFDTGGLLLLPGCADPFAPKTVRATMGACFRKKVYETSLGGLCAALEKSGVSLYATALRDDTEDIRGVDLRHAAVVIGSEGKGISEEALNACEKSLKIPMSSRCESLNAAVAASVVAWEMAREK